MTALGSFQALHLDDWCSGRGLQGHQEIELRLIVIASIILTEGAFERRWCLAFIYLAALNLVLNPKLLRFLLLES